MIAAVHQVNYIPHLGFFEKMRSCDIFVMLDDVQFTRNSFINRNRIKTTNGPLWLTVPVRTNGRFGQLIRDVEIDNSRDWARKHWKTIQMNYQKAKGFTTHAVSLEAIYSTKWDRLIDLNLKLISYITACLGAVPRTILTSSLAVPSQGTSRLVDICRKVGADTYLSGSGGRKYQDDRLFEQASIKLLYQDNDFTSNLSAIDYLLNEVK